jgi:hypothetical protein
MYVLGVRFIVLFSIEFNLIKEIYNNPTSNSVGFFYEKCTTILLNRKTIKTMLFSKQTSNHIFTMPQAVAQFGEGRMADVCSRNENDLRKGSDYQVNKPFVSIRNKKSERVKEIKYVFV